MPNKLPRPKSSGKPQKVTTRKKQSPSERLAADKATLKSIKSRVAALEKRLKK